MPRLDVEKYKHFLGQAQAIRTSGSVRQVIGLVIESNGPTSSIGEMCMIHGEEGKKIPAEVVGFRDEKVLLMPLGKMEGIHPGCKVFNTCRPLKVNVSVKMLGRVLDGLGNPQDGMEPVYPEKESPIASTPPPPLQRRRIHQPMSLGIRSIDGLLTCGKGQRMGIFSGSGVGKSTLMGMIARNASADVNVIALIGERGREVRDFIEKDLGKKGLERSVVVAATSDQPPLVRIKGASVATTIAEFFRDQGMDVILMMDSVTRFAMAQREVGLAIGEPPTTRGYTPSVFAMLPQLLERAGTSEKGCITGLYTVLVEGDDMNEPIADAIRAILDGHIVLSRDLASRNHYPPVDILNSVSRLMIDVVNGDHYKAAGKLRDVLATYRENEDLINIGAYVPKSNPRIDFALSMIDRVNQFLKQGIEETSAYEDIVRALNNLFLQKSGVNLQ